jgi:outer membrane receptor protein involved in Fe transport
VLLLCLPAFSQGSFGRILGTVTDQSGGVVAGATVNVTDTDRNVTRALTTDDAGAFNAPNLTPGNYTVRVEAKGFKRIERQGIALEVGHEVRVDLTVQPGEQSQTVTVTESVPLVETTNATMGGTLENGDIADLPLNGRDYQNLLGLRPGVMLQPGGGPWTQSTNGVRPDESVWMVDGVINANFFDARPVAGMPSPFMDSATILPIDAIQEFNVMENPKAEYGWHPGAVVNVGIKSGTNQLHGSAYAFGRVDSWDARNYYNVAAVSGTCLVGGPTLLSACNKVPVNLKQFGGVVGGPIKKDKLFFFAGYEGARSLVGSDLVANTPATASVGDPSKSMVDAIAALQAKGIPISAVSLATAGGCTTTCGGGQFPAVGAATLFPSTFPNVNQSDNGIAKIDYHVNDKNVIAGSLIVGFYDSVGEDHPFLNQANTDNAPIRTWTNTESWVYTPNSSTVNELRFGYDRVSFNFVNVDINSLANGTGVYNFINTGSTIGGFPNVKINGFVNAGVTLGTASNRPQYNTPNPYFDIQDSVSYLKGKHSFKFGGEYTHIEADSTIEAYGRGQIFFNGGGAFPGSTALEDFFAGTPSGAPSGQLLAGNAAIQAKWYNYAAYLQDDYRATQRVMINLGLRYEYAAPMKANNNAFGSFDPALGLVQQGSIGHPTIWKGDHAGFEPRVGIAWDVTGKGTTVVRGGASIIHTAWPLLTWDGEFGLQNDGATSLAADPTGAILQCSGINAGKCPATAGGTIGLSAVTFNPSSLCWDPAIASGPAHTPACVGGQKTIFPVAAATCGDGLTVGAVTNAGPCDIMGADPNLRSPYVIAYNLSIQHQFGSNLSLEVGYVGNRGYDLLNFHDINQVPLGSAQCLNKLTAAQIADACSNPAAPGALATQEARPFYTKFPYLGFINFATNGSHSNYNGLQATLTQRASHGLSFTAGYTYSHSLDNGSLNRFSELPQDSTNLAGEYASSDFDVRNRFTVTVTYDLPGIKGFGQMLEGWEINTIVNYQTPQPWAVWDGADNFSGTGENSDRWNIVGNSSDFTSGKNSIPYCTAAGCSFNSIYGNFPSTNNFAKCTAAANGNAGLLASLGAAGCYVSSNGNSVLIPNAAGTYGNMGRNIFRDSGFKNWDMSLFKNFKWRERIGAQFRFEAFNILNHPTAANPYGASSFVNSNNQFGGGASLGNANLTPDFAAGNPLVGSGSNRAIQLGLKLTFSPVRPVRLRRTGHWLGKTKGHLPRTSKVTVRNKETGGPALRGTHGKLNRPSCLFKR